MQTLAFGYKTHVGKVRKANQDSLAGLDSAGLGGLADGLFAVADGMGGRAGGEIASRITVETLPRVVKRVLEEERDAPREERLQVAVREALVAANQEVWGHAKAHPELHGMGTTCVVVLVDGDAAAVGNIGDSRVYLLRQGELRGITHDHSLVAQHVLAGDLSPAEARSSRYRNIITRAIGIGDDVIPDVEVMALLPGDTLLLCSDGLTNMAAERDIARVLARGEDPQTTCERLVEMANQNGGIDNTTVIVVRYGEFRAVEIPEPAPQAETGRPLRGISADGKSRSAASRVFGALPWLVALAALFLAYLLAEGRYEVTGSWPFLRPRTTAQPVQAPPPPPAPVAFTGPHAIDVPPLRPGPLAVTADGDILAVGKATGKLYRITPDGVATPVGATTFAPSLAGSGMAVDREGFAYVSSPDRKVIEKYDLTTGERKGVVGKGRLNRPEGLAIDAEGNLWVIDGDRLKVFRAGVKTDGAR